MKKVFGRLPIGNGMHRSGNWIADDEVETLKADHQKDVDEVVGYWTKKMLAFDKLKADHRKVVEELVSMIELVAPDYEYRGVSVYDDMMELIAKHKEKQDED